jgi:hypothetical protein
MRVYLPDLRPLHVDLAAGRTPEEARVHLAQANVLVTATADHRHAEIAGLEHVLSARTEGEGKCQAPTMAIDTQLGRLTCPRDACASVESRPPLIVRASCEEHNRPLGVRGLPHRPEQSLRAIRGSL